MTEIVYHNVLTARFEGRSRNLMVETEKATVACVLADGTVEENALPDAWRIERDRQFLVRGSRNQTQDWRIAKRSVLRRDMSEAFQTPKQLDSWLRFSPSRRFLIGRAVIHRLVVVDLVEEKLVDWFEGSDAVVCAHDNRMLFSGPRYSVWMRDMRTGLTRKLSGTHQCVAPSLDISPCGTRGVVASGDGLIRMWDLLTGEQVRALAMSSVSTARISGDLRWIVSTGITGAVLVRSLEDVDSAWVELPNLPAEVRHTGIITDTILSFDGTMVAFKFRNVTYDGPRAATMTTNLARLDRITKEDRALALLSTKSWTKTDGDRAMTIELLRLFLT